MKPRISFALLSFSLVATATVDQAYRRELRRASPGEVVLLRSESTTIDGTKIRTENKTQIKIEGTGDKLSLRYKQLAAKFIAGEETEELETTTDSLFTCTSDGEVLDAKGDEVSPLDTWLERLYSVVWKKSVEIGGKWTHTYPEDKSKELAAIECSYVFEGLERIGGNEAMRVAVDNSSKIEDGTATVKGKIWIRTRDGLPVKASFDVHNPEQGDTPDSSVVWEIAPPEKTEAGS